MSRKLQMIVLALGLSVVIAFTGAGCSDDDDDEPTVTPPSAPANVSATVTGPTTISVGWTASLDDAPDGYAVERRLAETDWIEIGTTAAGETTYDDATIEMGSGLEYYYRVGAYNTGGTTYSSQVSATAKTFNELLYGVWIADDAGNSELGVDSATVTFDYDENLGGYIYRQYQFTPGPNPLDTEITEEGVYDADGTSITWTAVRRDDQPVSPPDVYTWNYSMETTGEAMVIDHDYEGTVYDIGYDKLIVPTGGN